MGSESYTCSTCKVCFENVCNYKNHYTSLWHKCNCKRKILEKPPLSYVDYFEELEEEKVICQCSCSILYFVGRLILSALREWFKLAYSFESIKFLNYEPWKFQNQKQSKKFQCLLI